MVCRIDAGLLKLKFLYFFELSIYSILIIYINPFMTEWGMTVSELAIINFVMNLLAFILRPYFGYIADRHQNYKQIIILISLICTTSFSLNLAAPKLIPTHVNYVLNEGFTKSVYTEINSVSICHRNDSVNICWPSLLINCFSYSSSPADNLVYHQANQSCALYRYENANKSVVSGNSSFVAFQCQNISQNCNTTGINLFNLKHKKIRLTWSPTFWMLGILKILGVGFFSSLSSLSDSLIFIVLGQDRSHEYGFTRMFGTIGVLFFSFVTGGSMEGLDRLVTIYKWDWLVRIQSFSEFSICFVISFMVFIVIIIIVVFIHSDKSLKNNNSLKSKSCGWKFVEIMSLKLLFQDLEMAVFFIFAIFGGIALAIYAEYFIVVIYKMFPSSLKFLPAGLFCITAISEVLILGISKNIIKLCKYEFWVSLSFLFWSVRYLLYIYCNKIWHFILTEMIHGLTFGLQICAMLSFIGTVVAPSDQGKVQGLFSSLFYNIGGCFGGLIGGIILGSLGMAALFNFISILTLLCGITYYPIQVWIIARKCTRNHNNNNHSNKCHDVEINGNLLSNNQDTEIIN